MQPQTHSSICVRLTPKCRDSVQLVTKTSSFSKEIRLINRNSNDFVLYQFDQIYGKQTTNQMLYQNMIFTPNMGSMLDLESGLFCFLGSQGVGKTYTVTGQLNNVWQNAGLLGYFMQDVFQDSTNIQSQRKLSTSSTNNNVVELRFLQVLGDNVQNIGFQTVYGQSTNQRQLANRIDYKIDIKSLAHFQNCINKIYERKKPHMHLVIEVTLKNQPLIYTTKKTILTFIQISSACFDQGNVHTQKIKTQVQALITIFQNIQRIKHLEHLFEGSKLTKLLKNNFFEAKKISLIGILDNSFKGNSMTLKWLKMALQLKQDKTIIESMKQDIKKQEQYLKGLMQKHKKAMTLLSKCIGTELSFLQKQKNFTTSKRQIQFGFGNSFNKRCQKIKIANMKKQQNEQQIQKLNKQITSIQQQIDMMQCDQKQNIKKLQQQRNQIICVKNKLVTKMQQISQQLLYKNVFTNNNNNSIYWRPGIDFQNSNNNGLSVFNDKKGQLLNGDNNKKDFTSRNSSFNKMSMKKINTNSHMPSRSNIPTAPSITKIQRKKLDQQHQNSQNFLLQVKRQQTIIKQQTKRQIYQLFRLVSQQQNVLQNVIKQKSSKLSTKLINKIKNRQQTIDNNVNLNINSNSSGYNNNNCMQANKFKNLLGDQSINKYLKQGRQFSKYVYDEFIKNEKVFINISKDMLFKQKKTQQTIQTNQGKN